MECAIIKELLSAYIDDALDARTKTQIEEHLLVCKACSEELASLRTLVKELGSLEPVEPPENFLDQLHERMEPRFQLGKIFRMLFVPMRIKIPLEFATVAVVTVLVFSIWKSRLPHMEFTHVSEDAPRAPSIQEKTERPAQPALIEETYKAQPSFGEVTTEELLEERQIIELALVLKPDIPGKACAPNGVMEPSPALQEKAKAIAKKRTFMVSPSRTKGDREAVPHVSMKTGELKDEKGDSDMLSTVKHIIAGAEGNIISIKYEEQTGRLQSVHAEIPAQRYELFAEKLAEAAPLQSPPPTISDRDQKIIQLRIRFVTSPFPHSND